VTDSEQPRFFFIHLMKTGGTSFVFQMLRNFEPDEAYPSAIDRNSPTDVTPYASIPKLLALSPERRARIRVYAGHLPYVASDLLGIDLVRLTLLRDPVDRSVSMLKHLKRLNERHASHTLDEIYDDDQAFRAFIENYQTKVFALTAEERAAAIAGLTDAPPAPDNRARTASIDPQRFEHAKANLAKVDVIGLNERYGDFMEELRARFGWWPEGLNRHARANVSSEDWVASPELRRRIADENPYDMEFYEYAKELVEARRTSS
jgi:hypothetical protein